VLISYTKQRYSTRLARYFLIEIENAFVDLVVFCLYSLNSTFLNLKYDVIRTFLVDLVLFLILCV
jgi:hypothetical protein